ncbi:uncharacterized protein LOC116776620 [Danaus plexippus]|uniref:uncharacterized protein LOC116776620 n=1 Tax=Danaus plexippus TaxID=13037 RepID=UPI002AB32708|nr:uncharacterized protein LOC116776620 [Danaus plexippus]
MDKNQDSKKCFCARCFLPIEGDDKVDIEGQNFHRICSMCCVCRTIPTSLKMFYGHVFCNDCFKTHVMSRFKGENSRIHSNSWWMQWAPGMKPQDKEKTEDSKPESSEEPPKRYICARCLQHVEECHRVTIGDQSFHQQCAQCYFCRKIPTKNLKIYYGQVFCEECFNQHVLSRNRDNPSEFFRNCFEQWQNNAQFAENMRDFMTGNKESVPFVFMMQGQQPPFCRCGTGPQDWFQQNEPKKSSETENVTAATPADDPWELSFENRTEVSDLPESSVMESANQELTVAAAEKIEKLTKYLHERSGIEVENIRKWKLREEDVTSDTWIDLQDKKIERLDCPKCLWQCGPIYVNSEYLRRQVCEKS